MIRPHHLSFAIAALLCSCVSNVSLHRITPQVPVPNGRAIIVSDPFKHGRFEFPDGRYAAVWRDEGGVYYAAPDKIIASFLIPAGSSPVDGGIYVGDRAPIRLRAYIAESGYPPYKVPPQTDLQIKNRFTN